MLGHMTLELNRFLCSCLGVPQRYGNGSFKCEIGNIEMHEDKIKDDTYRFFSLKVGLLCSRG